MALSNEDRREITELISGMESRLESTIGTRLGDLEASNQKIGTRLGDLERTTEVINRFPYPQEPKRHVHREIKTHSASGPTYR